MNIDSSNTIFKLAYDFVNETNSTIYLTGKAGTGKTTFLKYVKQHCSKNMVVVAPTGVAAINAGGVTIHSFFQLPFGPYLPNARKGFGLNENVVDKNALLAKLKLNTTKRKLINELQLLIIDEVSMVRSDMLDAIDTVLKSIRKNFKPFGGVQVLFIGDLFQLPPVVKDEEKQLLDEHYQSPFFFHANVFKETQPVFIELKKMYRQNEQQFIDLLNKVRNNDLDMLDYELLESRYQPSFFSKENNYITLTSHNYKADAINNEELRILKKQSFDYKAEVKGDFNDKHFPTDAVLQLKEGAQVMFIKNDSSPEKKYYNGKIAIISKLSAESIEVQFPETKETLEIEHELWENISYKLNPETNAIEEKVMGTFSQYPLRLAWAITIHKSQGLTFERAIIDAGDSFAPGQVYVALSRCTSLDGIILHSRIKQRSIHSDYRIQDFSMNEMSLDSLSNQLQGDKHLYQTEMILQLFNWKKMIDAAFLFQESNMTSKKLPDTEKAKALYTEFIQETRAQKEFADKFIVQLESLLNDVVFTNNSQPLIDRIKKGIHYFSNEITSKLIFPLQEFIKSLQGTSQVKKYLTALSEVESIWYQKLRDLQQCQYDGERLIEGALDVKKVEKVKPKTASKKQRGDSAKESLAYYMSGKSVDEIAELRKCAISTIEGHLAEFMLTGELDIQSFVERNEIEEIKQAYLKAQNQSTSVIKYLLNDKYSHGQIKMALNNLIFKKEIQPIEKAVEAK